MTIRYLSDSDLNAVYKRQYYKLMQNMISTYGNVWGMLNKTYGQGGDEVYAAIQNTFGGGVGSSSDGTLPNANTAGFLEPNWDWNRAYGNVEVDGLAVETARSKGKHAFIKLVDRVTVEKMTSFNRWLGGMVLFNDGTGILGQFSGSTGGTAAAPVVTVLTTGTYGYRKGYFEVGDDVNVNSLSSVWRITAVDHDNNQITLSRLSGSDDLTGIGAGTHSIYMQNSKNNDMMGFKGIIDNSTHYNVAQVFRYQPVEVAAASADLEDEMLVELVEKLSEDTDEYPNLIVMPPLHFRKFLALQEDKKRNVDNLRMSRSAGRSNIGDKKAIARISYNGIKLASAGGGDIMVVKNKYVQNSSIYAINTKHVEALFVGQKPGFKNSIDGQVFRQIAGKDAYGAFLRAYGEIFINPFHLGAITGLPTS